MKSLLSFWFSLPGILTGLAAVISAIAALYTAGVFEENKKVESLDPSPTPTITTPKTPEIETTPQNKNPEPTPTPENPKSESTPEPTSESTPESTPEPKEQKIIETDSFKFQLQKCQRTRETVDCSFLITNLTDDFLSLTLYAFRDDRATDLSGNTYNFTKVEIADLYTTSSSVYTTLSSGLPVKANFYLKLPTDINKLAGFEFSYKSGRGSRKKLVLRNILVVSS